MCEIPFIHSSGSCECSMPTAAEFVFQVPQNLLVFCYKIQYFTVARHLTFSALSSCPFTCIHPFFPSIFLQLEIRLITVNIPCADSGYRHQGDKEQRMNYGLQSKDCDDDDQKRMRQKELHSQDKQYLNSESPSVHKQRKTISQLAHMGNTTEGKTVDNR